MRRFFLSLLTACLLAPQIAAAQTSTPVMRVLLSPQSISLPASGLILRLEADNLGSQWQTISGTTAVAADGDLVGTWNDLSTSAFNFTATADDGTRLTHKIVNGVHSNSCDGVDDKLRRSGVLGLYANGKATVMVAITQDTSDTGTIFSEANSGVSAPFYQIPLTTAADANDVGASIRNDAVTVIHPATTILADEALFNNTNHVITTFDTGSSLQVFVGNVGYTTTAYTRSGALTLNITGLCTDAKNGFGNFPKVYIQGIWVWNRLLEPLEFASALRYAKKKQGF